MFGLAHFHAPVRRLVSFAAPVMRDFSASAEQACHLAVYDRGSVVVIAQQESSTYWAMSMRVGAQMSLFQTGSGHVLLAFQNEVQRKIMITEQVRGGGETEPSDLEERLAEVRRNGFESMDSMQTAGVRNISAPVLTLDGTALAVITCPISPAWRQGPDARGLRGTDPRCGKAHFRSGDGSGNHLRRTKTRPAGTDRV